MEEDAIAVINWEEQTDDQDEGYILEVDLEYPTQLHRSHSSFPLAPERVKITRDMLSPYAEGNILSHQIVMYTLRVLHFQTVYKFYIPNEEIYLVKNSAPH